MTTASGKRDGKRSLSREALDGLLTTAGIAPARIRSRERLPGGTYNTLYRLGLADGTRLLLKLPPEPTTPAMSHERGLLHGEATFYRLASRDAGVPVPEVVYADQQGGFLLMTECPGASWDQASPADPARLRRELGRLTARLHAVTGPRFGYPAAPLPVADDWRGTFTAMLDAVLDDARRYDARLPVPVERIHVLAAAAGPVLAEVTTPHLVHFDLWAGNIMLAGDAISAVIDGERMFWGDPLAEFASLNLLGGPEDDPALLDGYRSGGGRTDFDEPARLRLALYRAYLYLIMLTEVHPRAYPPDHVDWRHREVSPHLTSALDLIAAITDTG